MIYGVCITPMEIFISEPHAYNTFPSGAIHKVRHAQEVGCPGKRYEALHGCGEVYLRDSLWVHFN